MMIVKTVLKQSPIHGLGAFADQFIPRGMKIGIWMPSFDRSFTADEFSVLPTQAQEYVRHYAYLWNLKGIWNLNADNMRFFNHSDRPNTRDDDEGQDWALEDIHPGEELTCDYRRFDMDAERKLKDA